MPTSIYLVLAVTLLCIIMAHRLAARKGLNPIFWGVLAGVFGPFIFPVLLLIKSRKTESPPASQE